MAVGTLCASYTALPRAACASEYTPSHTVLAVTPWAIGTAMAAITPAPNTKTANVQRFVCLLRRALMEDNSQPPPWRGPGASTASSSISPSR